MIGYVLVLLLSGSPGIKPVALHCTVRCVDDGRFGQGVKTCWYDEKPACARNEPICKSGAAKECLPSIVSLGQFDPAHDGITDTFAPSTPGAPPPPPAAESSSYTTSGFRLMGMSGGF